MISLVVLAVLAAPELSTPGADEVVRTAMTYLGRPYSYGSRDGSGYDCSGFVRAVFAEHGIQLPRTSRDQAQVGRVVARVEMAAADLLFFTDMPGGRRVTHVGMAIDGERMIHASTGRGEIVIDSLRRGHHADRLMLIRRVLGEVVATRDDEASSSTQALAATRAPSAVIAGAPPDAVPSASAMELRGGWATLSHEGLWLVRPGVSIVAPRGAAWLRVGFPFALDATLRAQVWRYERPRHYLRLLDTVVIGRRDAAVHLAASRVASLTLGDGALVREMTPAIVANGAPGLPTTLAPSLAGSIRLGSGRISGVVDDLLLPRLMGLRLEKGRTRPVALELALDPREVERPRSGVALAATMTRPLWLGDQLNLVARGAVGGAMVGRPALGGSLGGQLSARARNVEVALAIDSAYHDVAFIPGLFGYDYRYLVAGSATTGPLWDGLHRLGRDPVRWGWSHALRANLRIGDVVDLATAFDQGPARPETLPRRRLALTAEVREITLVESWLWLSTYVAYQQRFGVRVAPPLEDGYAEMLFAGVRARIGLGTSVALQVARRTVTDSPALDAFVELSMTMPM